MKAISLWQPWASLWLSPRKVHETRSWHVHRQWKGWKPGDRMAVHAAKRFEKDLGSPLSNILRAEFGQTWYRDLPTGALLGVVELAECVQFNGDDDAMDQDDLECGDFGAGRYGWRRARFWCLPQPVSWNGAQGIFEVPDRLLGIVA